LHEAIPPHGILVDYKFTPALCLPAPGPFYPKETRGLVSKETVVLPNHSSQHMTICGLSLHQGNTESRKNLEQKFIFQIGTLNPHGINERFSFN